MAEVLGPVAGALIAGTASLLGLVISKENKVSEFRQAWIDGLRDDVAILITHAHAINGASKAGFETVTLLWAAVRPDFVCINEAASRIRLRLNHDEPASQAILSTIDRLETLVESARRQGMDHGEVNSIERLLISQTQIVLKGEWNRVQSGERIFRRTERGVVLVLVVSLLALAGMGIGWFITKHHS